MKRIGYLFSYYPIRNFILSLIVLLAVSVSFYAPVKAHNGPDSVADLAEGLLDAVVNISTATNVGKIAKRNRGPELPKAPDGSPFEEFFDEFFERQQRGEGRPRRVQSLGSGFVIDPLGIIVTNNHVIDGADEITVNFANGDKLIAELVGRDEKTDLALLKVKTEKPLPHVNFGSSDAMRVGDWVMAIGNPFGLSSSVSVGIISARNRDINSGPYDNFLQTDAAINKGNSGGPLFNKEGEVIGINTAIFSPSGGGSVGVGFSVPSDTALAVISQLREFGETRRGWLGVRIQQVTKDIAVGLGLDSPKGALVAGVTETGPAETAGILAGDVVLTFDGKTVREMKDLPRMVADTPVGKRVDVEVFRKGETKSFKIDLGRLEEGEKLASNDHQGLNNHDDEQNEEDNQTHLFGMTVQTITPELRQQYSIDQAVKGLVITQIEAGSKAAEKNILVGDVILEVGQTTVESPVDLERRLDELNEEDRKSALFLLSGKGGELRFVAIQIE